MTNTPLLRLNGPPPETLTIGSIAVARRIATNSRKGSPGCAKGSTRHLIERKVVDDEHRFRAARGRQSACRYSGGARLFAKHATFNLITAGWSASQQSRVLAALALEYQGRAWVALTTALRRLAASELRAPRNLVKGGRYPVLDTMFGPASCSAPSIAVSPRSVVRDDQELLWGPAGAPLGRQRGRQGTAHRKHRQSRALRFAALTISLRADRRHSGGQRRSKRSS